VHFCILAFLHVCFSTPAQAHDLERTRVSLTFSRDGSFVLDISNDPSWLKLRLASFPGPFADRVVLFVDGHEVRPATTEFIAAAAAAGEAVAITERPGTNGDSGAATATFRMRGKLPTDAQSLRWYYGLVADPYPLIVRRADGRVLIEEIGGDAWSREIDVSGQFARPARWPIVLVAGLLAAGVTLRIRSRFRSRP
jgi:hypothetical protein